MCGSTSSSDLATYHAYATAVHTIACLVSAWLVLQYPDSVVVDGFPVSMWIPLFFSVTALGELAAANAKEMRLRLNTERAPWRWVEYSFSASFMLVAIAQLCHVDRSYVLIMAVVFPNVLCMATGYLLEATHNLLWFVVGLILGAVPWVFIASSFIDVRDQAPDFVTGIFVSLVLMFAVFPGIALANVVGWLSYAETELAYIVASFSAKVLLGAQVFGGALQSNADINY